MVMYSQASLFGVSRRRVADLERALMTEFLLDPFGVNALTPSPMLSSFDFMLPSYGSIWWPTIELPAYSKGPAWLQPYSSLMTTDLVEGEKDYRIVADIPGVDPNDLSISIVDEDRLLTIKAERKQDHSKAGKTENLSRQPEERKGEEKPTEPSLAEKKATREEKKDTMVHTERCYGKVERQVQLPWDADLEHAESKLINGVLTITFPKKAELPPKTRQLKIESDVKHSEL